MFNTKNVKLGAASFPEKFVLNDMEGIQQKSPNPKSSHSYVQRLVTQVVVQRASVILSILRGSEYSLYSIRHIGFFEPAF